MEELGRGRAGCRWQVMGTQDSGREDGSEENWQDLVPRSGAGGWMKVGVTLPVWAWLQGQWDCQQSHKALGEGNAAGEVISVGVGSSAVSQGASVRTY